jgi:hypothetical protein
MSDDFTQWKGVIRVTRDQFHALYPRLLARGLYCRWRALSAVEAIYTLDPWGEQERLPPERLWPGFLWVGTADKSRRPSCGAKTRAGSPCRAKVLPGKIKCRLHGGLSTGPKTDQGREAIRDSNRRRSQNQ